MPTRWEWVSLFIIMHPTPRCVHQFTKCNAPAGLDDDRPLKDFDDGDPVRTALFIAKFNSQTLKITDFEAARPLPEDYVRF